MKQQRLNRTIRSNEPSESIQIRETIMSGGTLGRNNDYHLDLFKRGAKIWIKDPERVWTNAELLQDISFNSSTIQVKRLSDGEEIEYDTIKNGMPFLCNPDILLGKDDLTHLSYLHEPAVLNNLYFRFEKLEKIYTYSGVTLVAVNPYTDCSHLYGEDVIQVYKGQGNQVRNLIPHIYAVAEEAIFDLKAWSNNQSIIVSGESGSGKTVSAKFIMKYLAHVASSGSGKLNGIEQRVLASNPLMESIGNAKTVRNHNSSRFGKFIQINFNERVSIHSAEIKTYLLEKSRVVFQPPGERNYHIFYYMLASNGHPLLADIQLDKANSYHYTNQGTLNIPGIDDRSEFIQTVQALNQLDISEKQQKGVFRTLAGLLMLGNINFVSNGEYSQIDGTSRPWINKLCSTLSIDAGKICEWLCSREMRAGTEVINKKLKLSEAVNNRDAMAKLIYATIFNWIVSRINENLGSADLKKKNNSKGCFIGVLDIYGFEFYDDMNSFEQFCINYANEKLQNSFNEYVFKLEQAEYQREEISFEKVHYYDNFPCIELISFLISLLDEQSKTGRGSDEDWLLQMETNKNSEHLQIPKIKDSSFIVKHFASDVRYNVEGFVTKNQDAVNENLLGTFANSKFEFLNELMSSVVLSLSAGNKRKKTVAVQFHESLKELSAVLNSTRPHYVRCIKPNDDKRAFCFEPRRAIEQLRACGVLETVRISAAGYPNRWTYSEFFNRYRVLLPRCSGLKEFAKVVSNKYLASGTFAFGKTKIFMKIGQIAELERIRHDLLHGAATRIQKTWRGFVQRRRYRKMLNEHHSAIKLQANIRGFIQRQRYCRLRYIVLEMQSRFRASIVRKVFLQMRYEHSAVIIQRCIRNYWIQRERIRYLRNVTVVQSCVRRWLARRELRRLKTEARSVNHLQNLNMDLANKLIELRQNFDLANHNLAEKCNDVNRLENSILSVETELLETKNAYETLKQQIQHANDAIEEERSRNQQMLSRFEELQRSASSKIDELTRENDELSLNLKEKEGEICSMQAQLVKNANLLISQDFLGCESSSAADSQSESSSDLYSEKFRVLLEQQQVISELRKNVDKAIRSNERLQSELNAQQLADSGAFRVQDLLRIQNLELLNQRYKAEIEGFVEANGIKEAFGEKFKAMQEENERLQEENDGIRYILAKFFETTTSSVNEEENQPITDSKRISQLVDQNLILQKQLDRTTEDLSIARSYLSGTSNSLSDQFDDGHSNELLKLEALASNNYQHSGFIEVFNIPEFVKVLIYDLRPRLAMKLPSCIPSYLLLAAFRYLDHTHNDSLISNLFNAIHVTLKDISQNFKNDFDVQALWLTNVWSLLNLLRQYSGGETEEEWTAQNTEKQNSLRMHNFNFEPIRTQLKLRVEEFYTNFMKSTVEPVLTPKIPPGILHHESAPFSVIVVDDKPQSGKDTAAQSLDDIKEFLSIVYTKLRAFGADQVMLVQVFWQISQWICSLAMNQLVFRKDLCTFEKAIQIKHNVTEVKNWLDKQKLGVCSDVLEPLVQASHLMQSRKDESNLDILAGDLTSRLTQKQIITILTSYNPPQGFEEESVNPDFIAALSKRLEQRKGSQVNNDSAIMLGTFLRPFDINKFTYSAEDIQKLTLPTCLKLDSVARLI